MHFSSGVKTLTALLAIFASAPTAIADVEIGEIAAGKTGINCKGHKNCKHMPRLMDLVTFMGQAIGDDEYWVPGQEIACLTEWSYGGGLCARWFAPVAGDNTEHFGANGTVTKAHVTELLRFGCGSCGMIPYLYPMNNNKDYGYLAVAPTRDPCCERDQAACKCKV